MNFFRDSNQTLYQIIQNSEHCPPSVGISPLTLQSYVETITQTIIEQQVTATIITKPPQSKGWTKSIQKYQQHQNVETIYLCGDFSDHSSKSLADATISSAKTIPIILGKASRLKRECFLLVLSEQVSSLILAQWHKGTINVNPSGKRVQQPYLETIISFEPPLIKKFLQEIKNTITENNPDLIIDNLELKTEANSQTKFLSDIICKQLDKENNLSANTVSSFASGTTLQQENKSNPGINPDFLGNLVAEMRSSLTYMKTTISLLESKQIKGESRKRYLGMLEQQCDRQNAVISGLLELLQLDNSTQADTIQLDEFVPGIVSTYQPLATEKQIQLGYTIPASLPPIIFPASWLRQIIIQLLNNSLQFTQPQGRVNVQAILKGENVELTIGDTGRGIEDRDLPKIFDSFYRTKTASNDQNVGVGLGLTIVRQLIEKSGGKISVTSKVGKGSNFKILLPVMPPELL